MHGCHGGGRGVGCNLELEPPRAERGRDGTKVASGRQDKVRVVGRDEEDWDAGHGEGRRKLDDAAADVCPHRLNAQDDISVARHGDEFRLLRGKPADGRLEDRSCPVGVADDRALERRHADVEERVPVLGCYAQPGQARIERLVIGGVGLKAATDAVGRRRQG